jgi:hypothetical protein
MSEKPKKKKKKNTDQPKDVLMGRCQEAQSSKLKITIIVTHFVYCVYFLHITRCFRGNDHKVIKYAV